MEKQTWDKQPNETLKAYKAFRVYLSLGYGRSLSGVSKLLELKSYTYIHEWSKKYNWAERASDFDRYQEEVEYEAARKAVLEMNEAHAKEAAGMRKALMLPVQVLSKLLEDPAKRERFISELQDTPPNTLFKLIVSMANAFGNIAAVERIVRGLPTDINRMQGEVSVDLGRKVLNSPAISDAWTQFLTTIAKENELPQEFISVAESGGFSPISKRKNGKSKH